MNQAVNIVGIISFVLIILQLLNEILSLFSPIQAHVLSRKYFSWNKINSFINQLAKEIKKTEKEYGMIVATGRGGGILAGLLSYKLDLVPVLILDRKYIKDGNMKKQAICIESKIELAEDFKELKEDPILLLTSRSDPGITLDKYVDVLKSSGFKGSIDKCAILASEKTADTLQYCLKKYNPNTKVKGFPWEKGGPDLMESLTKLTTKK